ncbi:uncharacterized protein MP3633_2687 [Marinomonas primoryensis]|uniref:Uncharacterized protein n=1 Tax=Marinomonas primoryensis TaxID=178399 RepID=A0A859CY06_9GAMM|nr:uncharacterized protein MP3633_2687 [Marinomonas primoryensis]
MSFEQKKKARITRYLLKKVYAIGARIVNNLEFRKVFYTFCTKKISKDLRYTKIFGDS